MDFFLIRGRCSDTLAAGEVDTLGATFMHVMQRAAAGFSLIEIAIVLVVIGVLLVGRPLGDFAGDRAIEG